LSGHLGVLAIKLEKCSLSHPDHFSTENLITVDNFHEAVTNPVTYLLLSYVRPSTKNLFHFNEIWYVGRGRRVMHDGMQSDPIQGQDQGHEPLKVGKSVICFPIYNGGWQITTDS